MFGDFYLVYSKLKPKFDKVRMRDSKSVPIMPTENAFSVSLPRVWFDTLSVTDCTVKRVRVPDPVMLKTFASLT